MAKIVARERRADPGCLIGLTDLGAGEYRIEIEPSPDNDGIEAHPVRQDKRGTVARLWAPWR